MFAFSTSFNVQECRIYRFCKLFSERKIYYRFCRQVIQYKEVIETKEVIVEKIVTKEVEVRQCRQFIQRNYFCLNVSDQNCKCGVLIFCFCGQVPVEIKVPVPVEKIVEKTIIKVCELAISIRVGEISKFRHRIAMCITQP